MTTDSPGIRPVELPETLDPSRLRVTVVSDSTPERNGVGSYYADLVEQLGSSISHAELICPEDRQTSWHRYLAPPLPGDSTQKIWLPRPFKLWSHISRIDPHVVVVPTPGPFGIAGMLAARRLGVPLIVGFHTHYEALTDIYWTDAFGRVCRSYLTWCNKLLFRNSSLVLANSPEMTRQATLMGAAGVELMGTSVPGDFLSRPRVPLNDTTRRILFAGRLAEEKNVPKVIEVARAMPDIEVSIAGDGPLKSIVEEAAGALPNLAYLGWVAREELIDTMDAHDILLLPSQVESFGTVALEGMARGRLVIVSGACGICEWPDLEKGLFHIANDETPQQAVARVVSLPFDVRFEKSETAHAAASGLNHWNVQSWVERIQASLGQNAEVN